MWLGRWLEHNGRPVWRMWRYGRDMHNNQGWIYRKNQRIRRILWSHFDSIRFAAYPCRGNGTVEELHSNRQDWLEGLLFEWRPTNWIARRIPYCRCCRIVWKRIGTGEINIARANKAWHCIICEYIRWQLPELDILLYHVYFSLIQIVFKGKQKNQGIKYEYTLPSNSTDEAIFYWKLSDFTPCSKTCGGGIQFRHAVCYKRYEGIVDDNYCWTNAENKKPEAVNRTCNDESCPVVWWIGPWQPCSATCQRIGNKK